MGLLLKNNYVLLKEQERSFGPFTSEKTYNVYMTTDINIKIGSQVFVADNVSYQTVTIEGEKYAVVTTDDIIAESRK